MPGQPGGADSPSAAASGTQPGSDPSATITALLGIGAVAGQGSELYRADDQPVVSLLGDTPLFRDLTTGVDDGADVRDLEENLVDLGYGAGMTVDETFDDDTAVAVRSWEEALGRANPDGSVNVGEVVFLSGPAAVLAHDTSIGDRVRLGSPVLSVGTESRVVDARIDATGIADWTVGTEVDLRWGDDSTEGGTIIDIGRDESEGQVSMVVALATQDSTRPIGTEVEVMRTIEERVGVLAVPVAAIVNGPEGPSVRRAERGEEKVTNVGLGVVADRWVEIISGLTPNTLVELPG